MEEECQNMAALTDYRSESAHSLLVLGYLSWVDQLLLLLHHLLLLRHRHLVLVLHLLRLHGHLLLGGTTSHVRGITVHDLLLLWLNWHALQRVHVLRVHEVVLDNVVIH